MKTREKMKIPLKYFEKLKVLTPYQVKYLQEYQERVSPKDASTKARIGAILGKTITALEIK
jgi:hypothetical protein